MLFASVAYLFTTERAVLPARSLVALVALPSTLDAMLLRYFAEYAQTNKECIEWSFGFYQKDPFSVKHFNNFISTHPS